MVCHNNEKGKQGKELRSFSPSEKGQAPPCHQQLKKETPVRQIYRQDCHWIFTDFQKDSVGVK